MTQRLLVLPKETRNRFATVALRGVLRDLDADAPDGLTADELDDYADAVEVLREAIADTEAGKQRDFEEFAAEQTALWKARGVKVD